MRHRFLFATDEREAGVVNAFILHSATPKALFAIILDGDTDRQQYIDNYSTIELSDHESGLFTIAFMPYSDFDGDWEPIAKEAFAWYLQYKEDTDDILLLEEYLISHDGAEYQVSVSEDPQMPGRCIYTVFIDSHRIDFSANENGHLTAVSQKAVPRQLIDALAEKIESALH